MMNEPTAPQSAKRSLLFWTGAGLAACAAAWAIWKYGFSTRDGSGAAPASPPTPVVSLEDPRLTYKTDFQNVRPEIQYVGDEACRRCHKGICDSYHKHPMGESLFRVGTAPPIEKYEPDGRASFFAEGHFYSVEPTEKGLVHRETRKNSKGETIGEVEALVGWVLGSGTRGRSYIIERDGRLFQSPVSWFSHQNRWDLSPGYAKNHPHFERAMPGECLVCHSNRVDPVPHTFNHYRQPIFTGFNVGCERCHGPGELHVKKPGEKVNGVDYTIVNPAHLEPSLREGVCQQCHLPGEERVVRLGRGLFDYRPGLPFHLFWTVFVKDSKSSEDNKSVSQVEQIAGSKCFQKSAGPGQLGCISCHDPHSRPKEAELIGFYRERCLACHTDKPCSLPRPERLLKSEKDSCIQCHMPRSPSADIAHTAVTDHRIKRRPDAQAGHSGMAAVRPHLDLVHFHRQLAPDDPVVARDLAVIVANKAPGLPGRFAQELARFAEPKLRAALTFASDDPPTLEALAIAVWLDGKRDEAMTLFERVLEKAPNRELSLAYAASLARQLNQRERAIGFWQRAIAVNPYRSQYHYELALAYSAGLEWRKSLDACAAGLKLNPAHLDMRMLEVTALLRTGEMEQARRKFDQLMEYDPPQADVWRRFFAENQR